jgi:hypothetical protein
VQVERGIDLVYGGGSIGLMGLVSHAVHAGGRHVIGSVTISIRVGLRFSKVRVSGDGGEALVPASLWNKSSLTLPLPVGILLRCRRRVSGGGVPFVNSLFRSSGLAVQRCLWVAVSSAFFVKVAERRWMSSSTPLKAAGQ